MTDHQACIAHSLCVGLLCGSASTYSATKLVTSLNSKLAPDWSTSTSWMTAAEQGSSVQSWVGKVVTISLLTESRVHAESDVILTIPDGWKPLVQYDIPAYYRNGCCVLRLHTDGTLKIWNLGDTTNAGRIYATFTYIRA